MVHFDLVTNLSTQNELVERDSLQDKNSTEKTEGKAVTRAHGAHRARIIVTTTPQSHYDFELVDKNVMEVPLGINKGWSIKRTRVDSSIWECYYKDCHITGKVDAVRAHAINHEIAEIKEMLQELNGLDLGLLKKELRKCSKDVLLEYQKHVKPGSALVRFILEELDDIKIRER
jgi:hypothetical protein